MRQDHSNLSLTAVTDFQQENEQFFLQTAEAKVKVTVFSDQIIQVRAIQNHQEFEDFSYAVVGSPQETAITFLENDTHYLIHTAKIHLEIQKAPLRFSFKNVHDQLINEDDPGLGISWIGHEVTNYKTLQEGERFIGLGEKTGNLDRRGNSYTCWNSDQFGYAPFTDPLYVSIPFYMGLWQGRSYGIFLDNTYETRFNMGASSGRFSFFQAKGGEMRYYFIHDDSITQIIEAYTQLTGRIQMPPMWSLGFQQCRYSYYPDTEIYNVAETFRAKDIPADVIYLDIHYMGKYKVFTWDQERFADPAAFVAHLKGLGFHVVPMYDPGIKIEAGYQVYEEGIAHDYFVKYPDGGVYKGEVWPGWCHFPDFTKEAVRLWWKNAYRESVDIGISGFWNDMNEPAVWGKSFPDLVEFDYDGLGATHKKAHNVYGLQMARSTFEGTKELLQGKRPFVLTRSGFAGIQRYAAVWTGDNVSYDEHMLSDVRILNSMGLGGISFVGCDVGGFVGEASVNLFNRWIALGAFMPLYRCHTMINTKDAEPWAFGEEGEEIARNYIKLRYRMLPYLYSAFYEATQSGLPINRSLVIDYTYDDHIFNFAYQNEYLFGPNILVCPVDSLHPIYKMYLPQGGWYDLFNDTYYAGSQEIFMEISKDKLPLFVKAGGILVMQSPISHTGEKPSEVLELHLYQGEQGSSYVYYEDDGETYAYENQEYYKRTIQFDPSTNTLNLEAVEGTFESKFTLIKIFFHGFDPGTLSPILDANTLEVSIESYYFVQPISNFDPYEYAEDFSKVVRNLPSVTVALKKEAFGIGW